MGILNHTAKFIFWSRRNKVSFQRTLMLGRQELYVSADVLTDLLGETKLDASQEILEARYAEPLFAALGAEVVDSVDFSDYEGATVIHDMNNVIPEKLKNKYSLVFDGGTLEHVFNFPTAIKNCMDMVEVGGHFLSVTPANNQLGHGFYQFSPELFFSLFSEQNGFEPHAILIGAEGGNNEVNDFFEVINPASVKNRVTLHNYSPTHLFILAKKIKDTSMTRLAVFQSDYVTTWRNEQPASAFKRSYKSLVPRKVLDFLWRAFKSEDSKKINHPHLGKVNPKHFKKIDLTKD